MSDTAAVATTVQSEVKKPYVATVRDNGKYLDFGFRGYNPEAKMIRTKAIQVALTPEVLEALKLNGNNVLVSIGKYITLSVPKPRAVTFPN